MTELQKSAFHTLIIDECTDIYVLEMLIVYFKYRPETETVCKMLFGGVAELSVCN